MAKARELRQDELDDNPLLRDLLEDAKAHGEMVISYQGIILVLQPIEDITHTFSPDDLARFAENYNAAEDPADRFTASEAIARFKGRSSTGNGP